MTLREILNAHKGYVKREKNRFQDDWERIRWLATVNVNIQSKKSVKPSDLMKFPWESELDLEDEIEKIKERRKWRTEH